MAISSRQGSFALAKQSAQGSAASAPTHKYFYNGSPSLAPVRNRQPYALTDNKRAGASYYTADLHVEGTVPLYVYPQGVAPLFAGVLGAVAESGTTPNYIHTITQSTSTPYFTMWRMVGGSIVEEFTDCKITSLNLTGNAGAPLTAELGIMGIKSDFLTADTADTALMDEDPYLYYEGVGAMLFATNPEKVHTFNLNINGNASGYQADDVVYSSIDEGGLDIEFGFSTRFSSATSFPDYRAWLYGNDAGTTWTSTVGTQAVDFKFSRNTNEYIQFQLPNVSYSAVPINPDPGGAPLEIAVACAVERPASAEIITVIAADQAATAYG